MGSKESNFDIDDFRRFLIKNGLKRIRCKGSHEVWSRNDLYRPVILPANRNPVAPFVIKNFLRDIGISIHELKAFVDNGCK
jgi:predicted RNA binding protein YcfA (HicA-like mRNA interferase family)